MLSDVSMLNKMSPFFVIIFSFLLLKEKMSPAQALAVGCIYRKLICNQTDIYEYGTGTVTDRTVRRDLRRYCLCDGAYPWAERTERFFGCNLLLGILVCGYTAISASGFPSDERLADLNASRCGTCGCRRTVRNYGGLLSCTMRYPL